GDISDLAASFVAPDTGCRRNTYKNNTSGGHGMSEQVDVLTNRQVSSQARRRISWRDYLELTKPRVVALMILTSVIGMLLATSGLPSLGVLIWGNLGIAFLAGAAAVVNHVVDQKIDTVMARTRRRPVATGRVAPAEA